MAKKKDSAVPGDEPTAVAPAGEAGARFSVQLTPDGHIAWDRMRPATKEQLKKALTGSDVAAQLGVTGDLVAPDAGIDPSMCGIIYAGLSTVMVGLARRNGYTEEQAAVMRFSPEETEALVGPTAKVVNKWMPAGKYQEELMLLAMVGWTIAGKVTLLRRSATVLHMAARPAADSTAPANAGPEAPIAG